MSLLGIGSIIEGVGKVADDLFTSDEERLKIALQEKSIEADLVKGKMEIDKTKEEIMNTSTMRCLTLCVCALLASCGDSPIRPTPPAKPQSRDEAAGVLISVNSVTPWSQVSSALQPNFTITGDTALAQVAPTSSRINEQVLQAFGLTAGIGLPQTSTQSTSKTTTQGTSQSGLTTTTDNTSTDTKQPGSVPQAPTGVPASAQTLSHSPPSGNVDIDPILKYQAAQSLYQAVTLMNQQVHSVASNKCFTPYLVQMKIAVMPYSEYLPFNLHARVSFFPDIEMEGKLHERKSDENCKGTTPIVVPVLITDDIEKAVKQNAMETARQIGFAVGGMVSGVAANININKLNQSIKDALGQDINSRLTVARLVDNTIYVRVGAANQATYGKSLMGQTYDVALILLVPEPYSAKVINKIDDPHTIQVVTLSEFRDIETNTVLQNESHPSLVHAADRVFQDMGDEKLLGDWNLQNDNQKFSIIKRIMQPVTSGDYLNGGSNESFEKILETTYLEFKGSERKSLKSYQIFPPLLWARLTALSVNSPFKTASFELPSTPDIDIPDQTVQIEDNLKDSTTATLQDISGITAHSVNIELTLHDPDRKRDYHIPATSMKLDSLANTLALGFPSLATLGIANFSQESHLTITTATCASATCPKIKGNKKSLKYPLLYIADETKPNGATFDFTTKQYAVITADGKASVTVFISKLQGDDVILSSDNTDIETATDGQGKPIPVVDGKVKVLPDISKKPKPQAVTLQLKGVTALMQINLIAAGEKEGADPVKKNIKFVAVSK